MRLALSFINEVWDLCCTTVFYYTSVLLHLCSLSDNTFEIMTALQMSKDLS